MNNIKNIGHEEKKVQLVFEFDRSEYDAFLFVMDQKKDEESEQVWNNE